MDPLSIPLPPGEPPSVWPSLLVPSSCWPSYVKSAPHRPPADPLPARPPLTVNPARPRISVRPEFSIQNFGANCGPLVNGLRPPGLGGLATSSSAIEDLESFLESWRPSSPSSLSHGASKSPGTDGRVSPKVISVSSLIQIISITHNNTMATSNNHPLEGTQSSAPASKYTQFSTR